MHTALQRKVRSSIRVCFTVIILVNAGSCIAMAVVGRSDNDRFNTIYFTYNILLLCAEMAFGAIAVSSGRQLERKILDASLTSQIDKIRTKIWSMKFGAVQLVIGQIPAVLGCIVFATLGSAPYFWIIQFSITLATPPAITFATLGLMAKDTSQKTGTVNARSSKALSATSDMH
jgi:hypothetical protein